MWWRSRRRRGPGIAEEIRFHRDRLIEDYVARGMERHEAERRAFLELGSPGAIEESVRDARGRRLDDLIADLRYSLRALRRTPGFTAVAVLTLALGIGANAGVVSLVYALLARPLPVPAPRRLVNIVSPGPRSGPTSCGTIGRCDAVFSYPMFRDLERVQPAFTGIAAHSPFVVNLAHRGEATSAQGLLVSGSYFPVLGLRPALGRLLGSIDDEATSSGAVVLSHAYWQRRFGGADVTGETVVVNGHPMTVAGVAPADFEGTTIGFKPDVFIPITMRWTLANEPGLPPPDQRRAYWLFMFARLKPEMSREQATAAIDPLYRAIVNEIEVPLHSEMSEQFLAGFKAKGIRLDAGWHGQSTFVTQAAAPLSLLAAFTALVLLIACLNVANLVLARSAARSRELATRSSIGATRARLVAQLLTESFVLSAIAATASLVVADWTIQLFRNLLPDATLLPDVGFPVAPVAAALAVMAGVAVGLLPAFRVTRPDVLSPHGSAGGTGHGRGQAPSRVRFTLASAQVALSLVLVILAGLFTKSLANLAGGDPGLRTDSVVMFGVSPSRNGYSEQASAALFERLEAELAALPGVLGVTSSTTRLLSGDERSTEVIVERSAAGADADRDTRYDEIGSGYFRALGVPMIAGREFTDADAAGARRVAVVNEAFVRKFRLGAGAVGTHIARVSAAGIDLEIVGVVRDFRQSNVTDAPPPVYFVPHRQGARRSGYMVFYVRTTPDGVGAAAAGIRRAMRGVDPDIPVEEMRTLDEAIRGRTTGQRVMSVMVGAFAALSLLVAAIGLYGMLSYSVAQRTPEIGVRMTLGATRTEVRWMVLRQLASVAATGGVIGVAIALLVGRVAQQLLVGLQFHDASVLASSLAVLAAATLAAGLIPAHRAASVDPLRALKFE